MVGVPWEQVIGKKVASYSQDIGEVERMAANYLESKDGRKHYYIPKLRLQKFDGHNVLASLTKVEIKEKYERDSPRSE
jgi:hypothetical protein